MSAACLPRMPLRRAALALAVLLSGAAHADPPVDESVWDCGDYGSGNYGPYDYNNPEHVRDKLPVVEGAHFTREVENLVRGNTGFDPMGDIDYVLRKFPNHHRALYAMARYFLRKPQDVRPGIKSPDCYFRLAMRWRPEDGQVRVIYGVFLHRGGRTEEALKRYQQSESLLQPSAKAELYYNLGLLYFDIKDYAMARKYAELAYAQGYPLPALRDRLRRIGEWPAATDTASQATTSSQATTATSLSKP